MEVVSLMEKCGFMSSLKRAYPQKKNVTFLKNEYGWGGSYPIIIGTGIQELHDGKGINLSRGYGEDAEKMTLKWTLVEKRIGELNTDGQILKSKGKRTLSSVA